MIWGTLTHHPVFVLGLRVVRQYLCRLETLVSLAFLWVLWLYVKWMNERYRLLFSGKQLELKSDALNADGRLDIGLNNLRKFDDEAHGEVWRFSRGTIGFYATKGIRNSMEDRMGVMEDPEHSGYKMYGIYDGHGGSFVSDFLDKHFLRLVFEKVAALFKAHSNSSAISLNITKILNETILSLDSKILEAASAVQITGLNYGSSKVMTMKGQQVIFLGSTLLSAFIHKHYLTVAHVGDSRAVICQRNGEAKQVTTDHKPDKESEKKRIEAAGGFVGWNGVWRVAGILATSRAIGDGHLKKLGYITAIPEITSVDLESSKPRFLILASDGLWDVVSNQEAVDIVKKNLGIGRLYIT